MSVAKQPWSRRGERVEPVTDVQNCSAAAEVGAGVSRKAVTQRGAGSVLCLLMGSLSVISSVGWRTSENELARRDPVRPILATGRLCDGDDRGS